MQNFRELRVWVHWILASDLGLMDQTNNELVTAGVTDVKKMLTGLVRKLSCSATDG